MSNRNIHLKNAVICALGFGFGLLLGYILAHWLLNSVIAETLAIPLDLLPDSEAIKQGVTFLIKLILSATIGGAVCGVLGGLSLRFCFSSFSAKKRWFIWRSAVSFALTCTILVLPVIVVISVIVYFRASDLSPGNFISVSGITGLVLGGVSGLLLGLFTVGWRHAWRIMLAAGAGFGLGGVAFGIGMWQLSLLNTNSLFSPQGSVLFWILLFILGAFGGVGLERGYTVLVAKMATKDEAMLPKKPRPRWVHVVLMAVAIIAAVYGVLLVRSLIIMVTPQEAQIAWIVPFESVGTHWNRPTPVLKAATEVNQPDLFVSHTGQPHLVWAQDTGQAIDIFYIAQSTNGNENKPVWTPPVNVSNSSGADSGEPAGVVDRAGRSHIVWTERAGANTADILYSRCVQQSCTPPVRLSNTSNLACAVETTDNAEVDIAIDEADTLMVTWVAGQSALIYSTWPAGQNPPASPAGCIPTIKDMLTTQPQVAGGSEGQFALVFAAGTPEKNGSIFTSYFANQSWGTTPEATGQGHSPTIIVDQNNQSHLAWCGPDNALRYWASPGQVEQIDFPRCLDRPGLAQDSAGRPHLVWYSNQVRNAAGGEAVNQLLYESVRNENGWSEAAIVSQAGAPGQSSLTYNNTGTLFLAWNDNVTGQQTLNYSSQIQYDCSDADLSYVSQAVLDVALDPRFHRPGDIVPFCNNQYEELVYTPNPLPQYSDQIPNENGGFIKFAELAKTARYEVLFSTMWYDADKGENSPGFVLAEAVAKLYQNLKANPEQYPKGLTVRILLDNPQKPAPFPWDTQLWSVVEDLRQAGVPEMVNSELGWKLEVANYDGAWPHAHAKMMVVDGKEAIAVGFNMQYDHFPVSNPSGLGKGRVDFGLHSNGPIVQATLASFDDLWTGSHQWHCPDISPSAGLLWFTACIERQATGEHVPEVLRYSLPDVENAPAFSLYRTEKYQMSDDAIVAAIESARNNIHITQVEFTADFICDFTPLDYDICTFEKNALPFMKAIVKAIETNKVQVNLIGVQTGADGYETYFGLNLLQNELAKKGLSDHFTVRFTTEPWHGKTILIDDQFVIVGSQNFQYAAWGKGQAEYNFGVQNPRAVEDYAKAFKYHWERAVPQQTD